MMHNILSTIGLGILGVDPITAVYLLSMGLKNGNKSKITLFFLSFSGFSIFIGASVASIFGATAVDLFKSVLPEENSPFWALLKFVLSLFIMLWVLSKFLVPRKKKENVKNKPIIGSHFMAITTGFIFALTSFTDPTFYAVILLGGETKNFFLAVILLTIWFLVSQFMAVIIYIAHALNSLGKLTLFIENLNLKTKKNMNYALYILLILIAVSLLVDAGYYLFVGNYLF